MRTREEIEADSRLSDDQLLARLRAAAQDASAGELADADEDDMAELSAALGSYRREALDWAEQRSATMPSPLPAGARTGRAAWLQSPQWVLGTVAFCGCVVGGALYTHHQAALLDAAATALPAAPTQQSLAADNELLSSVDDALSASVAPTARELGLAEDSLGVSATTRRRAQARSN